MDKGSPAKRVSGSRRLFALGSLLRATRSENGRGLRQAFRVAGVLTLLGSYLP